MEQQEVMEQEQGPLGAQNRLVTLVDRLLLVASIVFIVALASYVVNAAFGTFPLVKMSTTALTSFLLALAAIPLVIRYTHMIFLFMEQDDGFPATGSGIVCLALAIAAVSTVVSAQTLDFPQQLLVFFELVTLGFQLGRIFLRKE